METFTYKDYIKSIHTLRLNAVFQLAEEEAEYKLENTKQKKKLKNIHDEIIKKILKNKEEVANIINDFVVYKEEIRGQDLEKYMDNLVTRRYNSREADMVYKLRDENVFFLIKHQSQSDMDIAFKMLNYCVDIIYNWSISVKTKNEIIYPIVVPIVIYTATDKYSVNNDFSKMQVGDYVFKNYKIDFKYNLIEVKNLSIFSLIEKNNLFSYTMALGKAKNYEEFKSVLNKILMSNNKKIPDSLYDISAFLLENLLENAYEEEFLKKINFKIEGGKSNMSSLYEEQVQGFREDIRKWVGEYIKKAENDGKRQSIKNVVKNLINNNSQDEFILKITNITENELKELKKELSMNV